MPAITQENIFVDWLTAQLGRVRGFKVEKELGNGLIALVVGDPRSGRRIFIEFKQGGDYGELPVSSILSLRKHRNRLSGDDFLCLVSFSTIPAMLRDKLAELGILVLENPSVDEAVGKIQEVMTSGI